MLTPTATGTPVCVTVEENSPAIQYDSWRGEQEPIYYKHAIRVSKVAGDQIQFSFRGDTVTWVAMRGPQEGKAAILIDGVSKGIFNLYRMAIQPDYRLVFSGLGTGKHRIQIHVLGTKANLASDTNISHDAFIVDGASVEENSTRVTYNQWRGKRSTSASGKTYRINSQPGSVAQLEFAGSSIDWITAKGPGYGIAQVWIDGSSRGVFDLYAPTQKWQVPIHFKDLDPGQHVLEIKPLGTKNLTASGTGIVVDAFRVITTTRLPSR